MSSEAYLRQISQAYSSAAKGTPAAYKLMDGMAYAYDSLSNSANLSVAGLSETDMLQISEKLVQGPLKNLEEEIAGILIAGVNQRQSNSDPAAAKMQQQAQQEQIKKLIKTKTEKIEKRLALQARTLYERALAEEQTKQLDKLAGSDIASINGYSEEKINAMEDIANTFVQEPDDMEINKAS